MSHDYDVIVMGVGGMGSAALHALAQRRVNVCGIEQFGIAHALGSSHGDTRIIRKAYFEHPDYVPLLHRSYELWAELEEARGVDLFERCGFLTLGSRDSESIRGLEACYGAHQMPHDRLARDAVIERFPQFTPEADVVGFFDPSGGYLRVERCVAEHIAAAQAAGATLHTETAATSWSAGPEGVVVGTAAGDITAAALVLTAGAWAAPELRRLGVATEIWRKVLFWHRGDDLDAFDGSRFPTFYVETAYGHFYGFPNVGDRGVKVAEHLAVTPIDGPTALARDILPGDHSPVRRFIGETLPRLDPACVSHAVCMYTVTPDWHFVIDRHPNHANVVIAGGFSGHGFKFASVVGEIAADLALEGTTEHPIDFLRINRFTG